VKKVISEERFIKKHEKTNVQKNILLKLYNSSKMLLVLPLSESNALFRSFATKIARIQWPILVEILKGKLRLFPKEEHNVDFMMTILKEGEIRGVDIDPKYREQLEEQCGELLSEERLEFWQKIEKLIHDKVGRNLPMALEYVHRKRIRLFEVLLNFNDKKDGKWLEKSAEQFNKAMEKKANKEEVDERKKWAFTGGSDESIREVIRTLYKKIKKRK
jgi:hypothetical protein